MYRPNRCAARHIPGVAALLASKQQSSGSNYGGAYSDDDPRPGDVDAQIDDQRAVGSDEIYVFTHEGRLGIRWWPWSGTGTRLTEAGNKSHDRQH